MRPPPAIQPKVVLPKSCLQAHGLARIAPAAQAKAGHRVRMTGFMAKMERAPKGGFYLVPWPVACDEAGGGTADLPPMAVFVRVRSAAGQEMPWSPRALEVSGLFEAGCRLDADEIPTHFRILLDRPQDLPGADQPWFPPPPGEPP